MTCYAAAGGGWILPVEFLSLINKAREAGRTAAEVSTDRSQRGLLQ